MNTSTRVEFGLYDVTARSDSAPVTEDAKDFCNLSKDLLLESVPNQNKYGTLETRQWLMDGSFLFFPETPRQYFWGFWSTEQSNGNGAFANPPVLNMQNIQKDVSTKAQTAETAAKNAGTAKTAAQNAQNAAEKSAGNAANSESAAKTSAEQAAAARDTAQELAGRVTVDDTLSDASASPVQNKVIFAALAKKQDVQRVTFVINDTDGGLDAVVAD